ncbi:HipA family kinase [Candidatus Igneacidithiobacillus taiwanensis]|uniref:HipA family kinase n=1 Tax=Candidatus Igneacidithiobacillus taiwanensis TaxID=1945924 RepID=UPI00289C4B14|nr:HipA family kinase [Candidatus Igneacidithiobacillus taiwanensis]
MIRTGEIVPGTETPAGEGITAPFYCVAAVDGERVRVVGKRIPLEDVERECICAVVMESWGIMVPEPLILRDPADALCFGSLHAGYPNLKKQLAIADGLTPEQKDILITVASHIICAWEDAPRALVADEITENGDRNLGNFLWGGGQDHYYIDHERALGGAPFERNLMVEYAIRSGRQEEIKRSSVEFARSVEVEQIPA